MHQYSQSPWNSEKVNVLQQGSAQVSQIHNNLMLNRRTLKYPQRETRMKGLRQQLKSLFALTVWIFHVLYENNHKKRKTEDIKRIASSVFIYSCLYLDLQLQVCRCQEPASSSHKNNLNAINKCWFRGMLSPSDGACWSWRTSWWACPQTWPGEAQRCTGGTLWQETTVSFFIMQIETEEMLLLRS